MLNPHRVTHKSLRLTIFPALTFRSLCFWRFFGLEFPFYQYWAHSRIIKPLNFLCRLYYRSPPHPFNFHKILNVFVYLSLCLVGSPKAEDRVLDSLHPLASVWYRLRWLENIFKGVRYDLNKIHTMRFDALLPVAAMRVHLGNPITKGAQLTESPSPSAPNSITTVTQRPGFLQLLDVAETWEAWDSSWDQRLYWIPRWTFQILLTPPQALPFTWGQMCTSL